MWQCMTNALATSGQRAAEFGDLEGKGDYSRTTFWTGSLPCMGHKKSEQEHNAWPRMITSDRAWPINDHAWDA